MPCHPGPGIFTGYDSASTRWYPSCYDSVSRAAATSSIHRRGPTGKCQTNSVCSVILQGLVTGYIILRPRPRQSSHSCFISDPGHTAPPCYRAISIRVMPHRDALGPNGQNRYGTGTATASPERQTEFKASASSQ